MPKATIIIPVYNVEKFLKRCLDSVVNQTLNDIEIICVNDESTDDSLSILKKYQKDDERIRIISQENKGLGESRNVGLRHARGEYIFFLDSDDWIEPDSIEKLYNNAKSNDSDIVLFNAVEHNPNNQFRERIYIPIEDIDYDNYSFNYKDKKHLVLRSFFTAWTKFYRNSFLKENKIEFPSFRIFEDMYPHVKVMLLCKRISYLPDILYNYNRTNECSLINTKSNNRNIKLIFDVFKCIKDFLIENEYFNEFEEDFLIQNIHQPITHYNDAADEIKDEYYQIMRENFSDLKINPKIPLQYYREYIHVLAFDNPKDFDFVKFYIDNVGELYYDYINKKELDEKIRDFKGNGCGNNNITISLTSFPQRIDEIQYCIYSLLNQSLKPKNVVLWLAIDEFPDKKLPDSLLKLKKNGLTIRWCDNLKSFKKLIPSLKEYSEDIIVTCDDDMYYPSYWLERLYNAHLNNPNDIICTRARQIKMKDKHFDEYVTWEVLPEFKESSYLNFFTGVGGVLYPPNCLDKRVLDYNTASDICPSADDLWFWAMAVLNKTKITKIETEKSISINLARDLKLNNKTRLWNSNIGKNDSQVNKIIDRFPEILKIINEE